MKLIFDTETSGVPDCKGLKFGKHPSYKLLEKYKNSRLLQFCLILTDDDFNEKKRLNLILKVDFSITNSSFHGITNERSTEEGISIQEVAEILKTEILPNITQIYAHNADFDINILKSEFYRMGELELIAEIETKKIVCSMNSTENLVNVRNAYGVKPPRLSELYQYLFNEPMTDAHNGMRDTENLLKCLQELHKRRAIAIQ